MSDEIPAEIAAPAPEVAAEEPLVAPKAGATVDIYDMSGPEPVLGTIDPSEVTSAVASGQFALPQGKITVVSPDGELGDMDAAEAAEAFKNGFRFATRQDIQEFKYGTPGQQAIAGLEAAGRGLISSPLMSGLEQAFGVESEDILGREEANPGTAIAGEVAGLAGPALVTGGLSLAGKVGVSGATKAAEAVSAAEKFTQAGLLDKAGTAIAGKLLPEAVTPAARIGSAAVKAAAENGIYQVNTELGRTVLQDPNQDIQSAIANVGLASIIGGAAGGMFGTVPELWAVTKEKGLGKVLDRIADKLGGIEGAATKEAATEAAEAATKPLAEALETATGKTAAPATPVNPAKVELDDIFKKNSHVEIAPQDWTETVEKLADYGRPSSTNLGQISADIRRVKETNKVIKDLSSPDKTIGEIQEYIAGLNKDAGMAPITQRIETILDDLQTKTISRHIAETKGAPGLEAFEQLKIKAAEPPVVPTVTAKAEAPVAAAPAPEIPKAPQAAPPKAGESKTTLDKVLDLASGSGIGLASLLMDADDPKMNILYGIMGHHLGKVSDEVLRYAALKLLGSNAELSAKAFKAMVDTVDATLKGESAIANGAKAIFKPIRMEGSSSAAEAVTTEVKGTEKLDKAVKEYAVRPDKILNISGGMGHYLPDHASALGANAGNAVAYLNKLRPADEPKTPFGGKPIPSEVEKSRYNNALAIAQKPTIVLERVKAGTITAEDIQHLQALYPALYSKMAKEVTGAMMDKAAKGADIPYKTRLGVSLFLGQPLDPSLSPQSIIAAQPSAEQQMKKEIQEKPQVTTQGAKALDKLSQRYSTFDDSREGRRQKP